MGAFHNVKFEHEKGGKGGMDGDRTGDRATWACGCKAALLVFKERSEAANPISWLGFDGYP
jgi:hypothetical protein